MWIFTVITSNVKLQPEADRGRRKMYADGKAAGCRSIKCTLDWIVFVSVSVYMCMLNVRWRLCTTFACGWPVFLQSNIMHTNQNAGGWKGVERCEWMWYRQT